jgi:Spy/CpxP family protein refolding chaperone
MRSSILAALLVMGLVCGGCASVNTAQKELIQKTDALAKQNADLAQRLDAQDKAIRDLTTKVDDIAKIVERLEQQGENQGKVNRTMEAMLAQIERGAQGNPGGPGAGPGGDLRDRAAEWRERQLAQLSETLKLTDDQKEKVKVVMSQAQENVRKAMTEMRQSGQFDRDKMRETTEKLRNDTTEAMKGILTPEQMDGYKKFVDALEKAQQGRRGGERHDGANPAPAPASGDAQPPK